MEGESDGYCDGVSNGYCDGYCDGDFDGGLVGKCDGDIDGPNDGIKDGFDDGCNEGETDGCLDGTKDGRRLGFVLGMVEGPRDGALLLCLLPPQTQHAVNEFLPFEIMSFVFSQNLSVRLAHPNFLGSSQKYVKSSSHFSVLCLPPPQMQHESSAFRPLYLRSLKLHQTSGFSDTIEQFKVEVDVGGNCTSQSLSSIQDVGDDDKEGVSVSP